MPNLIEDLERTPPPPPLSPTIAAPAGRNALHGPVKGVTRIGARAGMIAAAAAAAIVIAIFYGISSSGSRPAPSAAGGPPVQVLATNAPLIDSIPGAVPTARPLTPRPVAQRASAPRAAQPIVLPAQSPAQGAAATAASVALPALPSLPQVQAPSPAALAAAQAQTVRAAAAQAAAQQKAVLAQQKADLERAARQAAIVVPTSAAPVAKTTAPVVASAVGAAVPTPVSPYTLQTGSVIPATLISGINSDLPGAIVAQVNQDVYDSKSGRYVLIPAGSKLIGMLGTQPAAGGSRVMVGWQRIIFPDAASVDISGARSSDGAGYAGLTGQVDDHQNHSFLRTALTTLVGVGAALLQPRTIVSIAPATVVMQAPTPAQQAVAQVGTQATQSATQALNAPANQRPPTVRIQPGTVFNVMVSHDLVLAAPYGG